MPFLSVTVAWHATNPKARDAAHGLFSRLNRDIADPLGRRLGIPVYFRSDTDTDGRLPDVELDEADHSAVVVLIDNAMVLDGRWVEWLGRLLEAVRARGERHLLLPVVMGSGALNMPVPGLAAVNWIGANEPIGTRVVHELCRLLERRPETGADGQPVTAALKPVSVFLSYARADGQDWVKRLEAALHGHGLGSFFDVRSIPKGGAFDRVILEHLQQGIAMALVALRTDAYVTRNWCLTELLTAKEHCLPVIVLEALTHGEDRGFPYLANGRSIPLRAPDQDLLPVVDAVLDEVLRSLYLRPMMDRLLDLHDVTARVMVQPPELFTLLPGCREPVILYPDPPLRPAELAALQDRLDDMRFVTPVQLSAVAGKEPKDMTRLPLLDKRVALSMSAPDAADLIALGLSPEHVIDAQMEMARHLLALGATLVYGGDLRPNGITGILFRLAREHAEAAEIREPRLRLLLAWPIHGPKPQQITDVLAENRDVAEATLLPWPDGLDPTHQRQFPDATDPAARRFASAVCYGAMRVELAAMADALVVLGGKQTGYGGWYPGLLEETWRMEAANKPVFVLGGFGGCAGVLAAAAQGEAASLPSPDDLPGYGEAVTRFGPPPLGSIADLLVAVRDHGLPGLRTGLENGDLARLLTSRHISELIALVLKGLAAR